jgi:hypothetical protein
MWPVARHGEQNGREESRCPGKHLKVLVYGRSVNVMMVKLLCRGDTDDVVVLAL